MKRSFYIVYLLVLCLIVPRPTVKAQGASGVTADGRVSMLREFYTAYITTFAIGTDDKLLALQRKYCTARLLKRIPDMIEKSDGDPFIKGQDSDTAYIKTLTIIKDTGKEGQFTVSYQADKKIIIHLMVAERDKKYKIDNVW
jgi:hypothetical protein